MKQLSDRTPDRVNRQTYAAHMASTEWAQRRDSYFHRYGWKCQACGATEDMHLHHRTYERFMHELDKDLVGLCSTCHKWVHQLHRSSSLTLSDATQQILDKPKRVRSAPAGLTTQQKRARLRDRAARQRLETKPPLPKERPGRKRPTKAQKQAAIERKRAFRTKWGL